MSTKPLSGKSFFPLFLKYTAPAILWTAFIFVLCTVPGNSLPSHSWFELFHVDKQVHVVLYALLVVFWFVGLQKQHKIKSLKHKNAGLVCLLSMVYGVMMEYMQLLIGQGRSFEWLDVLANGFGILTGVLLFRWVYAKWPR